MSWKKVDVSKGKIKYLQMQVFWSKCSTKREVRCLQSGTIVSMVSSDWREHWVHLMFFFFFPALTGPCTKPKWTANHHHHPHSGRSGWRWPGSNVSSMCPRAKHSWLSPTHLSSCHTWAEISSKHTLIFSSSLPLLWPQWDPVQILWTHMWWK